MQRFEFKPYAYPRGGHGPDYLACVDILRDGAFVECKSAEQHFAEADDAEAHARRAAHRAVVALGRSFEGRATFAVTVANPAAQATPSHGFVAGLIRAAIGAAIPGSRAARGAA